MLFGFRPSPLFSFLGVTHYRLPLVSPSVVCTWTLHSAQTKHKHQADVSRLNVCWSISRFHFPVAGLDPRPLLLSLPLWLVFGSLYNLHSASSLTNVSETLEPATVVQTYPTRQTGCDDHRARPSDWSGPIGVGLAPELERRANGRLRRRRWLRLRSRLECPRARLSRACAI